MKKIIAMVGASLFENYLDKSSDDTLFRNYLEDLRDKRTEEYEEEKDRINQIKKRINQWLSSEKIIFSASAEIKSLLKLRELLRDNLEIYLLASDTIISKIAGEVLRETLSKLSKLNNSKVHLDVIKNLQVKDRDKFARSGMVNLIRKVYQIADEYWENIVINITGGYKATIPYLTILAQVNRCPIYYIFEETDALIEIPYIPLDIRWSLFEKYEKFFAKIEREDVSKVERIEEDYKEVNSLLERADSLVCLNPLGVALWEKYKQRYDIFYVSELLKRYLGSDPNYERIAEKSFIELKRRLNSNPQDPDLNHRLSGVELGEFRCFKHKEENLQVRVLYKTIEHTTKYGSKEVDIYVGLLRIGQDVHNVESEYVRDFKNNLEKIKDQKKYQVLKIRKEAKYVS